MGHPDRACRRGQVWVRCNRGQKGKRAGGQKGSDCSAAVASALLPSCPQASKAKRRPFGRRKALGALQSQLAMILIANSPSVNAPTASARTVTGDRLTSFFHQGAMAVAERVSGSDAMIRDAT